MTHASTAPPEIEVGTDTDTTTEERTDFLPPYAVILHNDDVNNMDFVVAVLQKVFSYAVEKCIQIMLEAHKTGRAVAWVGSLEVAELKADQVHGCGGDPRRPRAEPLRVTVEPAG